MKLKMMLLAMCVCGGTSLLLGNTAERQEAPKTEEVKTTSEDNVAKAEADSTDREEDDLLEGWELIPNSTDD